MITGVVSIAEKLFYPSKFQGQYPPFFFSHRSVNVNLQDKQNIFDFKIQYLSRSLVSK